MNWRPNRKKLSEWWPLSSCSTFGKPRLPFIRSHQGKLVHRIRYWYLLWEKDDLRLKSAHPHTWCGMGLGTRPTSIGADVRLMADSSAELCGRCFPTEIADQVFATGHIGPGLSTALETTYSSRRGYLVR